MSYRVGRKVFETEREAMDFSKDLMSYGALGGWAETGEEPTHVYCGDLRTERIYTGGFRVEEDKNRITAVVFGTAQEANSYLKEMRGWGYNGMVKMVNEKPTYTYVAGIGAIPNEDYFGML